MQPAPVVVVTLPGEGLEWAEATAAVPGSVVRSSVEDVRLQDGKYQVTALVRATGFPEGALGRAVGQLRARYGPGSVDVLEPPGPEGALLRTRLGVDDLQSPYVRFLLRFHDHFRQVTARVQAGRLEVRAVARATADVDEDTDRIVAFVRKLGGVAEVRVEDGPSAPAELR